MFPGFNVLIAVINRIGKRQASFKQKSEMTGGRWCFSMAVDMMPGCYKYLGLFL